MYRIVARWPVTALLLILGGCLCAPAHAAPLRIVCAERVWCEIAKDIGGDAVQTQSILVSGSVDPHDFVPDTRIVRILADADLIVANGAGYDRWVTNILPASAQILTVSALEGMLQGEVHLFYDPAAVEIYANALAHRLSVLRPADAGAFAARARAFGGEVAHVREALAQMRQTVTRMPVASLEPLAEPLLRALGVCELAGDYAHAVMNGTEPSPNAVARLEDAITQARVRVLIVNAAFDGPQVQHLRSLASAHGVAIVTLGEVLPEGEAWADWLLGAAHTLAEHAAP